LGRRKKGGGRGLSDGVTSSREGPEAVDEVELGVDTTYGTSMYGEAGSGETPTVITVNLENLAPGSSYHYGMVAINREDAAAAQKNAR
jgi:ABC-type dipeptide/oligopeptide/nickel transport system ATPase component